MNTIAIKDWDSLVAWLSIRPESTRRIDAATIAQRSALRVFPLWSGAMECDWARDEGLTALPLLRVYLPAGSGRGPKVMSDGNQYTADIADVYDAADMAADAAEQADAMAYAADRAADAAASAAVTTFPGYSTKDVCEAAATAVSYAVDASFAYAEALSAQVGADAALLAAGGDLLATPLWSGPSPVWFQDMDAKARAIWADEPEIWSFWERWWDGVLSGRPLDGALQRAVAMIPHSVWSSVWDDGPAALAKAIAKVEASFHARAQRSAELIAVGA